MGWTSPSRDKRYGLYKSQQRQEIWAGQVPTETCDKGPPILGRDKTYGLDNAWQTRHMWLTIPEKQENLDGQFMAGTRHTGLTIPGRDKGF
jgi:hypothetical protein